MFIKCDIVTVCPMRHKLFLLYLLIYMKEIEMNSFAALSDKYLDVQNLKMYTTMSYKMCLRECSKSMRCMTINFDRNQLECFLLETNHTDSTLSDGNGFTHASPEKGQKCDECESDDTCIQLHNGRNVCMKTECSDERPTVQDASASQSNNPPFVSFECLTGYTGVGSLKSSTCRPGEPWSSINYRCEPPVHGGWSTWGNYGFCTVTCDGGIYHRTRTCTNPTPMYGGNSCSGSDSSSSTCNTNNCPVNGGWSAWGSYGSCTVTCGGGLKHRTRTCTNPIPMYGGNSCSGSDTSSSTCNTNNCPVNGGWSSWGSWGSCSETCGGGTQDAYRSCNNPSPQHGGTSCSGASSISQSCNTEGCGGGWWFLKRRR